MPSCGAGKLGSSGLSCSEPLLCRGRGCWQSGSEARLQGRHGAEFLGFGSQGNLALALFCSKVKEHLFFPILPSALPRDSLCQVGMKEPLTLSRVLVTFQGTLGGCAECLVLEALRASGLGKWNLHAWVVMGPCWRPGDS